MAASTLGNSMMTVRSTTPASKARYRHAAG
jgi:hypothetical protein